MLNVLFILALAFQGEYPTAPDGRRGFGHELSVQETLDLLHSSREEDQEFLTHLFGLESEVEIQTLNTRVKYQELGYFALLPHMEERTLQALYDAFFEQLPAARASLEETGVFPEAMARVWADVAFVLRSELLTQADLGVRELRGGRFLLLAHRDGFANLTDKEAHVVTARIDLAAARLRAVILDFDLLSKSDSWVKAAQEFAGELGDLSSITTAKERMEAFDRIEARLKKNLEAARSILFSTRLNTKVEKIELERDWSIEEGARYLAELLPWVPGVRRKTPPPKEILDLSKGKRYVFVLRHALAGLSIDPMNEDLCYYAARSSEFLYGRLQAAQWYDRYLALRGLRSYESSTTRGRVMTEKERRAYDVVQRVTQTRR